MSSPEAGLPRLHPSSTAGAQPDLEPGAQEATLVDQLLAGNRRALSRLLSIAERGGPRAAGVLRVLYPRTGRAHVVGVTGPPGAGKSTLVGAMARDFRTRGQTVGIVAVDPTSPFTGGAILGDRVRMLDLQSDPGVFVRSMASRGAAGGLARGTADLVAVLDAFGMDVVIVETVGAGQDEVEIVRMVDTTVVVAVPGLGDDVQALKAGILEIADILVVNKADREGAEQVAKDLLGALRLAESGPWQVPVLQTIASTGHGVDELVDAILRHRAYLESSGTWRQRRVEVARRRVLALVEDQVHQRLERAFDAERWRTRFEQAAARAADPYALAGEALAELGASINGEAASA